MRGVLVKCSEHGVQESTFYEHGPGGPLTIMGSSAPCPTCGRPVPVFNGSYLTGRDGELQGTLWLTERQAQELQEHFRSIQRIAAASRLSDDEAAAKIAEEIAAVARTKPEVAEEFRRVTEGQPRKAWSAGAKAITAALAVVGAYNTVADFSDRVAQLIRYFMQG